MKASDSMLAGLLGAASLTADVLMEGRLSILIFHRVLRQPDPLFPSEIDAVRFDRLMAIVAKSFVVLTLGQALAHRAAGTLPRRALTITFDDGYADNAEVALPILQRYGLRATFFVATGFLDGGRMFNDTVIETVRGAAEKPLNLSDFALGVCKLASADDRRGVIDLLLPRVKHLALSEREAFLSRLHKLAGEPALPSNLMMRSQQVVELHCAGMEIGGHTVRHPILSVLPDSEAEAEIADGRRHLQNLTGAAVDVFAYPNGRPMQDYDGRHVAMVRRLGFRGAVSTANGVSNQAADPFQLPRFTPWDRQAHRWSARLLWHRVRSSRYVLATA